MKRIAIIGMALAVVAGAVWFGRHGRPAANAAARGPAGRGGPSPVTVAEVESRSMPVERRTFGTVEPASTVTLRSQVTGILTNVLFAEGQEVRAGDLLFVIDPRPLDALRQQAEAARTRDTVQLANAEKEARRQDELFKSGITAEDVRDQAHTLVETLRAQLQADTAAVENARLQLEYCRICAPVSGRMGAILVHEGNLVKASDTALAVLNQIKPALVRFSLPQQDLPQIRERMAAAPLSVLATRPDATSATRTGTLVFVDNAVDATTGTIALKARYDNADEALWPGQYVTVALHLAMQENATVVPSRAVLPGQRGDYVYVVGADSSVSNRPVRVDRLQGDDAVVSSGLAPGERVVTDGQLRLAPGARVTIRPATVERSARP